MQEKAKWKRRSFSPEFKQDAVELVVKQGYSFKAAAGAVGIEVRTLRDWHERLAPPPRLCGDDATVEELTDKRLRMQLHNAEMEQEILIKKATAYFATESP